jgi:histidine ammonia-lyase
VDSIPTSANFEDFVSMGPVAARKAAEILRNVEQIVAIELLCAAQGVDLRGGSAKLGRGTMAAYDLVRRRVPLLKEDRPLFKDVKEIVALIQNGKLLDAVKPFVTVAPSMDGS